MWINLYKMLINKLFGVAILILVMQNVSGASAGDEPGFCQSLGRIVTEGRNKFSGIATGRTYVDTQERDAAILLPGMQYCRVGLDLANYNCWNAALSHQEAEAAAEKLVRNVKSCYPNVQSTNRTETTSSLIRSVTSWTLQNTQILEVVRRLARDSRRGNMVFFYVR